MIVITGGAGFIGSALLWRLNCEGIDEVVVVDDLGRTEKWRNLAKRNYAGFMHKDQFRKCMLEDSMPFPVSAIVHLGACSSTTEEDCGYLMENNFHYTQDVCCYGIMKGARIILASSAATYGDGSRGFSDDPSLVPGLLPLNMYGYSKQLADMWLLRKGFEKRVASLKFFNVYGPNEYHKGNMKSVAAKACGEIMTCGRLGLFASTVPGLPDGCQDRDFVYVKDCVELISWLLKKPWVCGIRNVGTGKAATFNELARAVFAAMGREPDIFYTPMPSGLAARYQSHTQAEMGWLEEAGCPVRFRNVQEGVKDYVKNYLLASDRYL